MNLGNLYMDFGVQFSVCVSHNSGLSIHKSTTHGDDFNAMMRNICEIKKCSMSYIERIPCVLCSNVIYILVYSAK